MAKRRTHQNFHPSSSISKKPNKQNMSPATPTKNSTTEVSSKASRPVLVMYPWLAVGHMTPFLHLANELAQRGCSIHFLLPDKAIQLLSHLNLHPHLITFHPITVPHVDGLPLGTQTASDVPLNLTHLLAAAFDRTRDQVRTILRDVRPDHAVYDMAHWVPEIAKPMGIKTVQYVVICAAAIAILLVPARDIRSDRPVTEEELSVPPPGYPSSAVVLSRREARHLMFVSLPFGENISFYERSTTALRECDAIAIRTYHEIEGNLCDYIGSQYNKPVFLTGPVLPEPDLKTPLDDRWGQWLNGFEPGSVIFCAFGSQLILDMPQFQELLLGFESAGLPFLVALKPPKGASTVEEALPEGFEGRVKGRGVVWGGWVQQVKILEHPSVGCFVNHCGFGSMWESLMSKCRVVLMPHLGDQILNTKLLVDELKVAVGVETDDEGWVSKESVCTAIKSVMDEDSEVGAAVKKNHANWREAYGSREFMSNYMDKFLQNIVELGGKHR